MVHMLRMVVLIVLSDVRRAKMMLTMMTVAEMMLTMMTVAEMMLLVQLTMMAVEM